ncbi:hypothetical protein TNCT_577791 [Trichonephila clavata]|uniref:Uncharacterized protein n=1 Tax=Trichonephila clavata TaxID=2740835 RepID=A0A8X6LHJ3_TRICU|nr:hypothetical protein TNCT_577791 [Trichonephila clavata]
MTWIYLFCFDNNSNDTGANFISWPLKRTSKCFQTLSFLQDERLVFNAMTTIIFYSLNVPVLIGIVYSDV